jgi:hypothetical protein
LGKRQVHESELILSFLKNESSKVEFSWTKNWALKAEKKTPGKHNYLGEGHQEHRRTDPFTHNELQPVPSMAEALASAKAREEALEKELKELQAHAVQLAAARDAASQRK